MKELPFYQNSFNKRREITAKGKGETEWVTVWHREKDRGIERKEGEERKIDCRYLKSVQLGLKKNESSEKEKIHIDTGKKKS